jgi:short-subunit dehydrogenase
MNNKPVIIITGASSGIGEASARLFAMAGYRMVLAARRRERLDRLAEEIESSGGQALPLQVDVGRLEDIEAMVQATMNDFGQIDILFNNAGFGRLDWLDRQNPEQDIESQVRVNLLGVIHASRQVLPYMIAHRSGHIINMASVAGYIATPTYAVYAATKFALRGFSEALRREVRIWNIQVSAVYPGGVETEFKQRAGIRRKTGLTTPAILRLSAEQVAEKVFSLVERPRRAAILPWPMKFAVWGNQLFPGVFDWIIERRYTRLERGEG